MGSVAFTLLRPVAEVNARRPVESMGTRGTDLTGATNVVPVRSRYWEQIAR